MINKSPLDPFLEKITGKKAEKLKILIIAAHPDDEVIGAGLVIMYHPDSIILHLTDGAPVNMHDALHAGFSSRDEYSSCRLKELSTALTLIDIHSDQCFNLNIIDQNSVYCIPDIITTIIDFINRYKPDIILTHSYDGGHPDHDTASFATWAACKILLKKDQCTPVIAEFATYHGKCKQISRLDFLPYGEIPEFKLYLAKYEQTLKTKLFEHYKSQFDILKHFPVTHECYRLQPNYNFKQPPLTDYILYDSYNWGINSYIWSKCIHHTLNTLKL